MSDQTNTMINAFGKAVQDLTRSPSQDNTRNFQQRYEELKRQTEALERKNARQAEAIDRLIKAGNTLRFNLGTHELDFYDGLAIQEWNETAQDYGAEIK